MEQAGRNSCNTKGSTAYESGNMVGVCTLGLNEGTGVQGGAGSGDWQRVGNIWGHLVERWGLTGSQRIQGLGRWRMADRAGVTQEVTEYFAFVWNVFLRCVCVCTHLSCGGVLRVKCMRYVNSNLAQRLSQYNFSVHHHHGNITVTLWPAHNAVFQVDTHQRTTNTIFSIQYCL